MSDKAASLSEREKEVLRLLLEGHDAKSTARALSLSVHSVNERLRSARRKLGVSSSREAARLLGRTAPSDPKFLGTEPFGLAESAGPSDTGSGRSGHRFPPRLVLVLLGGVLLMSLIVAGLLLASGVLQPATPDRPARWARIASTDASGAEVRNLVRLDGNSLTWNGAPISEAELRQFLDITTQMSPQPALIFAPTEQTKPARAAAVRAVIEDVLQCTPANCQEIAPPVRP